MVFRSLVKVYFSTSKNSQSQGSTGSKDCGSPGKTTKGNIGAPWFLIASYTGCLQTFKSLVDKVELPFTPKERDLTSLSGQELSASNRLCRGQDIFKHMKWRDKLWLRG